MRTTCRLSGKPVREVIDLGTSYVSNFLGEVDMDAPKSPLRIGIGEDSALLQLMDSVERTSLYRNYWYRSGTNATMRRQLQDVVDTVCRWVRLRDDDIVLDVGCNDGTLLSCYPDNINLVKAGIDPAENLADLGRRASTLHAASFFTKDCFFNLTQRRRARVITTIAMFYGLEDPHRFVSDLCDCLMDDGIWVLQLSYTPLMIKQNAFDNICHEHLEYYTLFSLKYLLDAHDLKAVDVEFNDTNSGSFRVVVAKKSNPLREVPLFVRDLGEYRLNATLDYEIRQNLMSREVYEDFMRRLVKLRADTRSLVDDVRKQGKSIYGYGASTKGNTLLQFYGLTGNDITAIAERQPQKYGLLTVGSWIPIVSEQDMREANPDYLFVLPWHFIEEFRQREGEFRKRGGKFIVPLPALEVI